MTTARGRTASTALRKPAWFANDKNPLDRTTSTTFSSSAWRMGGVDFVHTPRAGPRRVDTHNTAALTSASNRRLYAARHERSYIAKVTTWLLWGGKVDVVWKVAWRAIRS